MIRKYKRYTLIFLILGFVLLGVSGGLDNENRNSTESDISTALVFAGTIVFCLGCMYWAKGKGYHDAWGLLGLLNIFGILILLFFKDKTKKPKVSVTMQSDSEEKTIKKPKEKASIHSDSETKTIEKPEGPTENKEYLNEINRLKRNKLIGAKTIIEINAPPLRGLASKMLQVVAIGAITGSPNIGALSVQHSKKDTHEGIVFPDTCCLCNIYAATRDYRVYREVVSSWAGMLLGGPLLGMDKIEVPIPVCYHCEKFHNLAPGVQIIKYKKIDKVWKLKLEFSNEKVAEKFRNMNQSSENRPIKVTFEPGNQEKLESIEVEEKKIKDRESSKIKSEFVCPDCYYFDENIGVCSYLHFNVSSNQKHFYKKCNGKYFKERIK